MIPQALRLRNRWLIWRYEQRGGKRTKVPYNANLPTRFASVTDPRSWAGVRAAELARQLHRADGIGYVLGDGHAVIDLDNCLVDGQPTEDAQRIVAWLRSYTEISPSGKGLHIFVRGFVPPGRNRRAGIEVYDRARYIAMTGDVWDGLDEIRDAQEELSAFCAEYLPPIAMGEDVSADAEPGNEEDEAVLQAARNAINGEKFVALWEGRWPDDYPSQSEADFALVSLLVFWCKGNADQVDRLFRRSGLYREKWDRVGTRTIQRALLCCV